MGINLQDILPYIISAVTGVAGVFGGMRLKKANEKKAEAEAEAVAIDNDKKVSEMVHDLLVEPLKKEIAALRRDVRRLQRVIDKISDCPYSENCPVRKEMQKKECDYEK
jgi:hypothetical protein